MAKRRTATNHNIVVVSDLHCGCAMGLCPPGGVVLDDGGMYMPSRFQKIVWGWWQEFWNEWVPEVTDGEPYTVVCNGDAIDGSHHGSTTQITQNLKDQVQIAYEVLSPVVEKSDGRYYHIRGTEAHVGKSGEREESLAMQLGAVKDRDGRYARWELRKRLGDKAFAHFTHHIGTTGSNHYESTAPHKELMEMLTEAGRWGHDAPHFVVRSHRHRHFQEEIESGVGRRFVVVTPGWQGKTPFTWKIAGARINQPQFGGVVLRESQGTHYVRAFVRSLTPDAPE